MKKTSIKKVNSIGELINEMTVKRDGKTRFFYHYTSLENYIKMRASSKIELTRGDSLRLNDQLEKYKGGVEEWKNTYIACFTGHELENVAMWETYSFPLAFAIRVSVAKNNILDICENKKQVIYSVNFNGKSRYAESDLSFVDLAFTGVSYWNYSKKSLYFRGETLEAKNKDWMEYIYSNPEMLGRLKNKAWKYENEFRILAKVKSSSGKPLPEKIAIDAPEMWINNRILCSPCMDKIEVIHYLGNDVDKLVENSELYGCVNLPKECICCKKMNGLCSKKES